MGDSESESDAYENVNDTLAIFTLRTTARRRHTKAANRLLKSIEDKMPIDKITDQLHIVEEACREALHLNERYKIKAVLSEDQLAATEAWKGEVQNLYDRCRTAVENYSNPNEDDEDGDHDLTADAAKRRRLHLEYELEKSKTINEREIEDLRRKSQREQEDLRKQIEFQRKLEKNVHTPVRTSTMIQSPESEMGELPRALWPKITLNPFNGDPRSWPDFIMSFNALVHETRMPDAYKMIALRENLTPEVKRRVANLFMGNSTYQAALDELKTRYGTMQVIMHAHIQQLSSLPPFRSGDFKSLVNLASLVRDAVSSVNEDTNPNQYAYSNVVSQLVKILPQELQRDWGRYAHPLRPNVPTLGDFDKWIDGIVGAEELIGNTTSIVHHSPTKKVAFTSTTRSPTQFRPTVMATHVANNFENQGRQSQRCSACQCEPWHGLEKCSTFRGMSPTMRAETCAKATNCFRCLGRGHISRDCRKTMLCNVTGCERKHHPLLHGADRIFSIRQVLLAFVPITLRFDGHRVRTFALLDPGSEATLIRKDFSDSIGLHGNPTTIELGTYRDMITVNSEIVRFEIESQCSNDICTVREGFVVPSIKLSPRQIDWPNIKHTWDHLADLELPPIDTTKVTVLIGMDVASAHLQLESRRGDDEAQGPIAVRTPFGWSVVGPLTSLSMTGPTKKRSNLFIQVMETDTDLVHLVENFYLTESFGTYPDHARRSSSTHDVALEILKSSIEFVTSHFQIRLLWKSTNVSLPNNRMAALRRFFAMERRLLQHTEMAEKYVATIDKYVALGYVRAVRVKELEGPKGRTWFLHHHGVFNPNKPGKLRLVFDGSAKFEGTSLNDVLLRGPIPLSNMTGIIIRSREFPFAVSADIEAMYHQVKVHPEDQAALRFLWRNPGSKLPPKTYQWERVPFGLISSPASCIFVLQHTASNTPGNHDVSTIVTKNFYVDNYVDSFEREEEAIVTIHKLIEVLAKGGFRLNQWVSSSRIILVSIPASERNFPTLNLDLNDLPVERSLGMIWNCHEDSFHFLTSLSEGVSTKRQLLSAISKIFDPLGLLLPVTTFVKVLFQVVWRIKEPVNSSSTKLMPITWDDQLPVKIINTWTNWNTELTTLHKLKIPRCLRDSRFPLTNTLFELHVFCDASEVAFGAVCYMRMECENEKDSNIMFAKSRVAPLKTLSIPRLELQAAVLATRIVTTVKNELRLPVQRCYYWTDSEIVLRWINSNHHRYSVFVANRITEILDSSSVEDWNFVPGSSNPADDCSRGILPSKLISSHRWFKGPSFLQMEREKWPKKPLWPEGDREELELRKEKMVNVAAILKENPLDKMFEAADDLEELKVTVAQKTGVRQEENVVSAQERKEALTTCIKAAQQARFYIDIQMLVDKKPLPNSSRLLKLTPFLDQDGVLRVGGRIDQASASFDSRHPIILDANHPFTDLVVKRKHDDAAHGAQREPCPK